MRIARSGSDPVSFNRLKSVKPSRRCAAVAGNTEGKIMDQHDPRNDSGVRSLDGAPKLHKTPALIPRDDLRSYISGYIDGEGCFCVSFQPSRRHRFGWEVRPSFRSTRTQSALNSWC